MTISAFGENERSVFNPTSLNLFFGLTDLLNLILSSCVEGTKKYSGISASLPWVRLLLARCLIQYLSLELNRWCQYLILLFWSLFPLGTIVFLEFLESRSNELLRFLGNGL